MCKVVLKGTKDVAEGVSQQEFEVYVAGETVPCVLWTPKPSNTARALIAMGHGGSQHKKSENICTRALRYAKDFSWATLAIDAPKHGDRISAQEASTARAKTLARVRGEPNAPSMSVEAKIKFLDTLTVQAVPEWQAALDSVLDANTLRNDIPIAYWGVSQGSSIGIPLLAEDKRFSCAVLGLAQLHPNHTSLKIAAEQISIPLRFAFQWDDATRERDYGLALFNAFGSQEKSMHINPGGHIEIPASEDASWDHFFKSYLP